MNLPIKFEEKMKDLLQEEYEEYIKCYDEPRLYGLRVNTRKISGMLSALFFQLFV